MNNKIVKKLMAVGLVSAAMFAQADTEVVNGVVNGEIPTIEK